MLLAFKGPRFYLSAGNSVMFLVVREAERFPDVSPRTWPLDWEVHGTTVKKVMYSKVHKFLDIFVICSSFFFSLSAELLCQWEEEENVLFRGMYHNKKLISTNCSKITQKLSPCSSLCQWWAVLFSVELLPAWASSCALPAVPGLWWAEGPASLGFSWSVTSYFLFETDSHGSKVYVFKTVSTYMEFRI